MEQFSAMNRFAVAPIQGAFLLQNFLRHSQPDLSVNAPVTAPVELMVVLQDHEVIAKEPRGVRPRVGDQGLGVGEFKFEVIAQEHPDRLLDLLGFAAWPAKPKQPIVRLAQVSQAPISWLVRVKRRDRLQVTAQTAGLL